MFFLQDMAYTSDSNPSICRNDTSQFNNVDTIFISISTFSVYNTGNHSEYGYKFYLFSMYWKLSDKTLFFCYLSFSPLSKAIFGIIIFNETITIQWTIGITLILIGIILLKRNDTSIINRSSNSILNSNSKLTFEKEE